MEANEYGTKVKKTQATKEENRKSNRTNIRPDYKTNRYNVRIVGVQRVKLENVVY